MPHWPWILRWTRDQRNPYQVQHAVTTFWSCQVAEWETGLKVSDQLVAHATRFLIVRLKIPEMNVTELITTQLCRLSHLIILKWLQLVRHETEAWNKFNQLSPSLHHRVFYLSFSAVILRVLHVSIPPQPFSVLQRLGWHMRVKATFETRASRQSSS